jgi:lysophospholipase L1-like esterase
VKPDVIILKECAAYFPGDLEKYKEIIQQMVKRCEDSNVKPVLATVVPVTKEHSLNKPGRLEAILSYNDWIKTYAQKTGLVLIDLELPLRVSEKNRSLRPELTDGDGLHLNRTAYDILDKPFLETLNKIFP